MPTITKTRAILFADIARSTSLYEKFGDDMAQSLVSSVLAVLTDVAEKFQGRVVKTIGDEVMCEFPGPNDAVQAAVAMQKSLERKIISDKFDMPSPNIYVGLHYGPVIMEDGDVFGDAVNVAARMVEMAKPRQVLTLEETVQRLTPDLRETGRMVDTTTIRGKTGEFNVYELVWEHQDQTVMVDSLINSQTFRLRLEIHYRDQVIAVDQNRPSITIGRQPHNDLVVEEGRVSRSHCRIEYRRGKFVVVDQSSNGTYVLPHGGSSTKVRRDEAPLYGHGTICLGRMPDPDHPDALHFIIKS